MSRLVIVVMAVASVTVIGSRSAGACSITGEEPDLWALAHQADAVFVGTTTAVETRTTKEPFYGVTKVWTMKVDGVAKGDVAETQVVVSPDMASCGMAMREPGRYVIYAKQRHDVGSLHSSQPMLVADVFGGTHFTASPPLAKLDELGELGELRAPRAGNAGYPDGRSPYTKPVVSGLVVGGLVAAVAVVGAWLVRRRRRQTARAQALDGELT